MLWPAVVSALLPSRLHDLLKQLPGIIDQFSNHHPRCSPMQIQRYINSLGSRAQSSAWGS